MRPYAMLGVLALVTASMTAQGYHVDPCTPTGADPSTYISVSVAGRTFYDEERGNPFGAPVPLSGFLFGPDSDGNGLPEPLEGQGTWLWEEANGLPGLQRGGRSLVQDAVCPLDEDLLYPFCTNDLEDPIVDETCGAGPDQLLL